MEPTKLSIVEEVEVEYKVTIVYKDGHTELFSSSGYNTALAMDMHNTNVLTFIGTEPNEILVVNLNEIQSLKLVGD